MVRIRHKASWLSLAVLGALFVVALLNRQAVSDWFRLYGYEPTGVISKLATDDMMTPAAEHLYYINRPEIVAKADFSGKCTTIEQTIILGCYHSYENGIYILKITGDERLDGVMQVTAAHEMLHAAYDRLSTSERQRVDEWLRDYYENDLTDKRIKQTIELYKKTEPNDVVNEMHSVFGTEVGKLPAPLEAYYSRYFTDRQKVVGYTADYQAEFTKREKQVAVYDKQLTARKLKIDADKVDVTRQSTVINQRQATLNALKESGQYEAYNAGVDDYNRLVRTYNALIAETKSEINAYNALVSKRNAVALETKQLNDELQGSDLSTISQ